MRKYLGGGFITHVPARDLTDAESKTFADIIAEQEELTGVRLYEPVKKPAKSKKSDEGTEN